MRGNPLLQVLKLAGNSFTGFVLGIVIRAVGETGIQLVFLYLLHDVFVAMVEMSTSLLLQSLQQTLGYFVLSLAVFMVGFLLLQRRVADITAVIRQRIFSKLHSLPIGYFKAHHSGETLSRMTNDVNATVALLGDMPSRMLFEASFCLISAFIIFRVDYRLGLVAVFSGTIGVLANTLASRKLREISRALQAKQSVLTTTLTDLFAGIVVIKSFSLYPIMERTLVANSQSVQRLGLARVGTQAYLEGANFVTSVLNFMGLLLVSAILSMRGEISVPEIVLVVQAQNGVERFFTGIGAHITGLQSSWAAAERVVALQNEPDEPTSFAGMNALASAPVAFRDVEFAYADGEKVIDGISLTANKGEMIALVGPSGGGKSTLLKLIMGFYEPQKGSIIINGATLSAQSLAEARGHLSYVPQDAHLFSGTIADNIRCGRLEASNEEVVDAAKAANAHDFIMALGSGYETEVGEKGAELSGGQRQRIAIARAVIRRAPILLLDEATASLDSESEALVQEALNRLMQERTVVVVAHRLSTIEKAHKIIVVAAGRVVEEGTHGELLATDGMYRSLHEAHLAGQSVAAD
ncbi:MAG: putative multidrug export ATP-binding/permease protein [Firmicutes bacterium]|nr:putative multidrug export ATP-binding/permease protein [Bacillota bacterium]